MQKTPVQDINKFTVTPESSFLVKVTKYNALCSCRTDFGWRVNDSRFGGSRRRCGVGVDVDGVSSLNGFLLLFSCNPFFDGDCGGVVER